MMTIRCFRPLLAQLVLVLGCVALTPSTSVAATVEIAGNPLEISVLDDGQIQVLRYEASISDPGVTQFERQYFSAYYPFLVANPSVNGVAAGLTYYSGYNSQVTPVSNVLSLDGNTITNTVTADNGNITMVQTVTYVPGAELFQHTWVVTNNGLSTYNNVAFRYGGDTYFNGVDLANGFWDPNSGMVYCTDPNASGLMGMQGGPSSAPTQYYEDYYGSVWTALANVSSPLPNTVNPNYVDNGMGLEWDQNALAPNGSFTVTAIERWTTAGVVQVLAPSEQPAVIGMPVTLNFVVQNLESTADTFALAVTPGSGITASVAPSVQIAANSTATVPVTATVTTFYAPATVTLVATSSTTSSITNSDVATFSQPVGSVVVTAPSPTQYISLNTTHTVPFTVQNNQIVSDTFTMSATGSSGLTITSAPTVTIAAGATTTVNVSVTETSPPSNLDSVALSATSTTTPSITSSATEPVSVAPVALTPVTSGSAYFSTSASYSFEVSNGNSNASETFSFTAAASPGVFVQPPAPITLAPGALGTVIVLVTTSQPLTTALDSFTLTATAASNAAIYISSTIDLSPSPVVVVSPQLVAGSVGATEVMAFTVYNNTGTSGQFTFLVSASTGLTATTPPAVNIGIGSSTIVDVTVTITSSAGIGGSVLLTANGPSYGTNNATSNVVQTAALGSPALAFSHNGQTVYNTICPSTPEGVANLLSVLSGTNTNDVAAYCWDATVQTYARLPTQPTGGVQISTGVFIASRNSLGLNFTGTPSGFPYNLTLQPGWNFIGMPVLNAGDGVASVTSHPFPGNFDFYDNSNSIITDPTVLANTLGTVGSNDYTTAEPYLYNGSSYVQVSTMTTAVGYWIKNNTAGTVIMSRLLGSSHLSLSYHAPLGHDTTATTQGSPSDSAPVYVDRGEPPAVPGNTAAATSGSGNGCGLGTGVAAIFGISFLFLRRRLRA